MTTAEFKIGDRVRAKGVGKCETGDRLIDSLVNSIQAMDTDPAGNGVVVYRDRRHDPKHPRVRWASGWGISYKAEHLVHLTPTEQACLPMPDTFPCDQR